MKNFRIRTTLSAYPRCGCHSRNYKTIVRGATAILSLNMAATDYVVDYDRDGDFDFKQLTLVFKQPNGGLCSYDYYMEDGTVDSHFNHDPLTELIDFTLSAQETAALQDADVDSPME